MNSEPPRPTASESGRTCRDCGIPLGPRLSATLCPRCALQRALLPQSLPEPEGRDAESSGRPFGEYRIHEEIGRGGMGVIYRARHVRLHRWVALKVLAGGEFASADFRQRFRTEAEAAASLEHPNIVPIYEVGEEDGESFFSMKLVEGGTLTTRRPPGGGEVAARACATAVVSLARAVQYAHERGVLHRDLKPNNVLVDCTGTLFLTDFGLARLVEKDSSLTRSLAVLGTPSYMSPEQARGEARQITTAADVYGLGAILYELLAGRPPFTGASSIEILRHVVEMEPLPPSRVAGAGASGDKGVGDAGMRDLDTICLKCLEKDPARRYSSAEALARDLERWLNHEPILARQSSTLERVRKWVRRKPAWAALTVTILVSVLALGMGSALFTAQLIEAREAAEQANLELSHNLFVREWQDAEELAVQEKPAGALPWFARAVRERPDDPSLATRLLALLSEHAFPMPTGRPIVNDAPIRTVGLTPDDSRLVMADSAGRVRCWSLDGGSEIFTLPRTFDQPAAAFLRDGPNLLVVDRSSVSIWGRDGGPEPLQEVPERDLMTFDLSADGRRVALSWRDGRAEVWDAPTLDRLSRCSLGDGENPNFLRLSRDGRWLLRSRRSELRVFDASTGRHSWSAQPPLDPAGWFYARADFADPGGPAGRVVGFHMAGANRGRFAIWPCDLNPGATTDPGFLELPAYSAPALAESSGILVSRDSARALVWARSGLLICYSMEDGSRVQEPIEHPGAVVSVVEAGSGEWFAAASERTVQFWDLAMKTPRPQAITDGMPIGDARFGPDGRWLAVGGSNGVRILETETRSLRRVLDMPGAVLHLAISSDGRRLAAHSSMDEVRVWDPGTGALQSQVPASSTRISHLALSPDRRWFATAFTDRSRVQVYEVETGRQAFQPLTNDAPVVNTQFSPDGRLLAVPTISGSVAIWELADPPTGEAEGIPPIALRRAELARHEGVVWMAQFSPDGRLLATASNDRTARIWDVATGKLKRVFRHQRSVYHVQFGPEARVVVTGCGDRSARLWNLADGRSLGEPMEHPGAVWYGEFSDDGRVVLTGDDTGHARLWDAATGLPLGGWVKHGRSVKRLRLAPGARQALIAAEGSGIRLWRPLLASERAPSWLPDLAEAVGGFRQLDRHTMEPIPAVNLARLRAQLMAEPGADFYSRWARWFLVDRMRLDPPAFP